ncbi:MAG: hypothetical protein WBN07_03495 [Woeseiaceae bacterium]
MKNLALLAALVALTGCAGNYKNTFEHPAGAEPVSLHVAPILNQEELSVQIVLADSSAATAQYGALGGLIGGIIDASINSKNARKAEIRAEILRELAADYDLVNAIEQTTLRIGNDERWKIVTVDKPVSTTKDRATAGEVMDRTEADAVVLLTASYAMTPALDQLRADIQQKVYLKADRKPGKNPSSKKTRFFSYLSPKHPLNYRGFNDGEKESLMAELDARYDGLIAAQPDDTEKLEEERADAIKDLNEAEEIPEAIAIREAWSTQLLTNYLNQAVDHLTFMLQEDWRATAVPEEAVRTASTFSYVNGSTGALVADKGQEIGRRDDNIVYRTQWGNLVSVPAP